MAQSAYMIGMGIERAKELADRSNEDLMSTLEETSALSRSAMWEMRHPMEIGEIFEGMELGGVLESLAADLLDHLLHTRRPGASRASNRPCPPQRGARCSPSPSTP